MHRDERADEDVGAQSHPQDEELARDAGTFHPLFFREFPDRGYEFGPKDEGIDAKGREPEEISGGERADLLLVRAILGHLLVFFLDSAEHRGPEDAKGDRIQEEIKEGGTVGVFEGFHIERMIYPR